MEILVHQAIFGENNNRHSMLCSSLNDKELLDELEFSTDRPLSTGHWQPYTSGFPLKKYYVLLRIAPDKRSSAIRGGWRIVHALIVQRHELLHWRNLMQLIQLLPENPTRLDTLSPLPLTENETDDVVTPPGFSKLASLLVKPTHARRTLVWVGNEGYLEAVHTLWRNVWPSARMDIRFTYSYRPQDVDSHFALVSTPVEYIDQWRGYDCIKSSEHHEPSSDVERLLLGQGNIQALEAFVREADIERVALSKLGLIYQAYEYYSTPNWEQSLKTVRPLARLIAEIVPDPKSGINLKARILERLRVLTIDGTVEDILALRNLDTLPFQGQEAFLAAIVEAWGTRSFPRLQMKHASDIMRLLEGQQPTNRKYWNEAVHQLLKSILATPSSWNEGIAGIVWQIWIEKPALIPEIASFFGNDLSIQDYLVRTCPSKLTEVQGKAVCTLAARRNWLKLHAAALAGYTDVHTAFRLQTEIDTHPEYVDGIRELATRCTGVKSAQTMLEILVDMGEKRAYIVAGELCARYPSLLQTLNLSTPAIVEIWLNAISHEEALLENSAVASEVIYKLLDMWLEGKQVRTNILERIGRSRHSDLTEYARRADVWEPLMRLSYDLANRYLSSTAKGWLFRFKQGQHMGNVVEERLAQAMRESSYLRELLASPASDAIPVALRLFAVLPNTLRKWEFEELFLEKQLHGGVSSANAALVGTFIAERRWEYAARKIARYVERNPRSNWMRALEECQYLLFKQKGFWSIPLELEPLRLPNNEPIASRSQDRGKKKMNTVLFLATNPSNTARLRLLEEHRSIVERLRSAQMDKAISLEMRGAVRPNDLQEYLLQLRPHVVHFSGHGDEDGRILLENEAGTHQPIPIEALTHLFQILKDNVQVILINACWSKTQAESLATNIDYVIGMSRSISDESAIRFAEGFYRGLGYGLSVKKAFELGKNNLELHNHADSDVPQILIRPGTDEERPLFVPRE